MSAQWFSAMVKLVVLINGSEPANYVRSVFVFCAPDWDAARARAVELGRGSETAFTNADGESVTWRLMSVETLDLLGDEIVDGREVYSYATAAGTEAIDLAFAPEASTRARAVSEAPS